MNACKYKSIRFIFQCFQCLDHKSSEILDLTIKHTLRVTESLFIWILNYPWTEKMSDNRREYLKSWSQIFVDCNWDELLFKVSSDHPVIIPIAQSVCLGIFPIPVCDREGWQYIPWTRITGNNSNPSRLKYCAIWVYSSGFLDDRTPAFYQLHSIVNLPVASLGKWRLVEQDNMDKSNNVI